MNRPVLTLTSVLLGLSLSANAAITTIIDTTGGTNTLNPYIGCCGGDLSQGEIVGMDWTQTGTYTNVSIAVSVRSLDQKHTNVTAYLTTAVGSGATAAANLVAQATVNVFTIASAPYPLVTFFTGLTLGPGTYYLTLVGDANVVSGVQNASEGNATPVLDTGVTLPTASSQYAAEPTTMFGGPIDDTFPPASTFFFSGLADGGGRQIVKITAGLAPPTIQKQFGDATIPLNGTTSLAFTITNPNSADLTGVAFTDTLPTGLTVATSTSTVCGGTLTTTAPTTIAFSGGDVTGSTPCQISVTVTGATSGSYTNTTGAVSSTNGGTGTTSNTADLTVVAPPTISKSFGSSSVQLNTSVLLNFIITNPNSGTALTGVGFTDTLPSGLTVASGSGPVCGGTLVGTAPGTIALSGASIAAGGNCNFSLNVKGVSVGTDNNTTGAVTSANGGTGTTSNTATVTIIGPPSISISFDPTSIPLNGATTLTLDITNPNASTGLTGIAVTDILPTGLTIGNLTANVCGGTVTTTAPVTISFSGVSIPAGDVCQILLTVTGATAGHYTNTTGVVSSANGGTGAASNGASLTVVGPPSIQKGFNPSSIPLNSTTSLTFTITNSNTTTILTGVGFTDTLPTGLTVPNGTSTVCGGTLTTTAPTGVALSGASIAASGQCQFSVTVTGASAGNYTNTTGPVSSTNGGTGSTSNTASLTVAAPPSIQKGFSPTSIPLNSTTTLTFTITNPNTGTDLTGVAFTDTLPAGLTVPTATSTVCGGTLTTTAPTTITLSGATVTANSQCQFSVIVTGATAGSYSNTTGAVSSANGGTGTTSNTVGLTVVAPPSIQKGFSPSAIPVNGTSTLTFTITNSNAGTVLTGVAFTDTLPTGLTVANATLAECGGTLTATAPVTISLSGASIAANSQCQFSVTVTGVTAGSQKNTSAAVTSTNGGTGNTASDTLLVLTPPTLSKVFGVAAIAAGQTTTLSFTITNPNSFAQLTGVGFTDNLPAGLTVSTPNGLTGSCGGGIITAVAGSGSVSLSGATLLASASCTFIVNVTAAAKGSLTNTTQTLNDNQNDPGNPATANLAVVNPPSYQIAYAANLNIGDSVVNISNDGSNGGFSGAGTTGNICVNAFIFDPQEEEIGCCACLVTPNGLYSLSAKSDLVSNNLTPALPTSITIHLVASTPGVDPTGNFTVCNPATIVSTAALAGTGGLLAWGTTLEPFSTPGTFGVVPVPFINGTLSNSSLSIPPDPGSQLGAMTSTCAFIQSDGTGYGICNSCRTGALGGAKR